MTSPREVFRLRDIETAARHLRSQLYVGGKSYNEAKYDAEQALDKALAVSAHQCEFKETVPRSKVLVCECGEQRW